MIKKNTFLLEKEKIYLFLTLLVFKLVLDFVYIFFIHKFYEYSNFTLIFNAKKYIFSLIWYIAIYLVLPKDKGKTSSIILLMHFMIMILPIFTIYSMKNESSNYFNMVCFCFLIECIILNVIPDIKVYNIKQGKYIYYSIIALITIFVYSSMIKANGIPTLKALNFLNVYSIRDSVKYPFLMDYFVGWQAKAINPLMIAVSYKYKRIKTMSVYIALQLVLYLITANRAFLLTPIAILVVMYTFKHKYIMNIIGLTGSAGCMITYFIYNISNSLTLPSLFIRRFMFVPAQLKFFYYDFISQNKFLYFSKGIIGKIIKSEYPYDMNFVNLISDVYFKQPTMASNTGYFGTGYSNLGFLGMIVYALTFSLILKIVDSIGRKLDTSIVTGIIIFSMLTLNDSDLLTTLLTGGMMFLIILLYLYAGIDDGNQKN